MSSRIFSRFVQYDPTVPSDWPVVPTNAQEAFDDLAARKTQVQYIALSGGQIAAKQIVLIPTPRVLASVEFRSSEGSEFVVGSEFTLVAPNIIDWTGKTLDGFLNAGDNVVISYDI